MHQAPLTWNHKGNDMIIRSDKSTRNLQGCQGSPIHRRNYMKNEKRSSGELEKRLTINLSFALDY